ncbi:GNAT family N-acetyltransferase [Sphingosinicellaceae bacterium]|nr:GNAT family N-acetyltransferase [Sphingosinicellaceae bacterium]
MAASITTAAPGDWEPLGRVIGSAFAADPVSLWTLGSAAMIVSTFQALARYVYLPRGRCFLAGENGGTMWLEPGRSKELPLGATLAVAAKMLGRSGLGSVRRALAVDAAMKQHRPVAPHLYLFAVGVAPGARGQGLGQALLAPVLAECDATGTDCYLENSNPRNTSFYAGQGFVPGPTFIPAPGCPPLMPMWRPARSA